MTLEIEIKTYADDLKKVEHDLKELGAIPVREVSETDTYFRHPVRDFVQTDEAFRIRVSGERSFLTYKGKRIENRSKTREEIEVEIDDANSGALLLARLGFNPVADVKKVRKVYHLGDFEICLDEVEELGTFVEVEVMGEAVEELRDKALSLLKTLDLENHEWKSYLELLLEKRTTKTTRKDRDENRKK
jgi:adenylate cyclase class 2